MKQFSLLVVLFINTSLAAQNWTQIGADIDGEWGIENSDDGDASGTSVSISSDGKTVAIGAPYNNGNGTSKYDVSKYAGHVRVFNFKNGAWIQIGADIDGKADGDYSGTSVSLSSDGSIVAIGSPQNGNGGGGHVRVFRNNNNNWTQVGSEITDINGDWFGYSVSLSSDGKTIAIGDPKYGSGSDSHNIGSIGIFKNVNGVWTQIGSNIRGVSKQNQFGWSVCVSADGNTVVGGSPWTYGSIAGYGMGQVRVFRNTNSKWTKIGQTLKGFDDSNNCGWSVSLSTDGNVLAIGSRGANHSNGITKSTGIVRVLNLKNNQWVRAGSDINLEIGDINGKNTGDNFGFSVSLSSNGETVAIGAMNGQNRTGYVSIFTLSNGQWVQLGNDIIGEAQYNAFGSSVSLSPSGDTVAIGAPRATGTRSNAGHVRVYSFSKSTNKLNKLSSKLGLTVYPNPAGQFVVVESLPELLGSNYSLISAEGIEIIRDTIKDVKSTLDISNLKNGVYFLKIENNLSYTKKIIKCF